ncbi:spermidine synthase [Cohnella sp. CFH 77786]|uniref:spermine/spermidine synthase domain-containing protein n=1 Tax=Cohnella sp. CFH 77786 TaxID=2662265 RepID=UPI001C610BA2|nr:methyltransferase [Cohnella sp. CFH 77786]MBW5445357.1 spermidine synthase [Cohnella sp. CFH 77786]
MQKRSTIRRIRPVRGDYWDLITLRFLMKEKPKILYRGKSRFQNIVMLETKDIRLYLDKQLQFSSVDERVYHEALVHPAMSMTPIRRNVLILGGGDGFALREVLKYKDVRSVDLVELDPKMIELAKSKPVSELNGRSLADERVQVYVMDARKYLAGRLKAGSKRYNVIIQDFPDPADKTLSKLYTKEFYQQVGRLLAPGGKLVVQANSTEDKPSVYWSIYHTLRSLGMHTRSYYVYVPSFGDWGFQIASYRKFDPKGHRPVVEARTLPSRLSTLFKLPKELLQGRRTVQPNSLKNLRLFQYFHRDQNDDLSHLK